MTVVSQFIRRNAFGVACLLAMLLLARVVRAEPAGYDFAGRIIVMNSRFDYSPIEIRLMDREFEGTTVASSFTEGGSGKFVIRIQEEGDYYVLVQLEGYEEVRQRTRTLWLGNAVVIFLKPVTPEVNADALSSREMKAAIDAYGRALDERAQGNFQAAAKLMQNVVDLVPDFPDAHLELGEVYVELLRYADAKREFRVAYDLNPQALRPLLNLGRLYLLEAEDQLLSGAPQENIRPNVAKAHDLMVEALTHHPKSAMARYLLGSADYRSASFAEAEAELKLALSIDGEMIQAKIMLINTLVAQEKWQVALDALDKFILEHADSSYLEQARHIRSGIVNKVFPNR